MPHCRQTLVAAGFLLVALAVAWPLPVHLATRLTGSPAGDTGIYVWNIWVFFHEATVNQRLPFFTSQIFGLSGGTDLSLHNYTTFANLLAFPLIPLVGVVPAFNLVYLLLIALSGGALYLLARDQGLGRVEAWLAGVLFTASPVLVARGSAHFSLVAAAPLPIFTLLLLRALRTGRLRYALGAGATVAWAAFSDVYYAVYCLLIACVVFAARAVLLAGAPAQPFLARATAVLNISLFVVGGLVVGLAIHGGGDFSVLGIRVQARTLYTPVLVLTALALLRLAVSYVPRLRLDGAVSWPAVLRFAVPALLVAAALLTPVLYAFSVRLGEGLDVSPPVHWRSSPPGVDLAFLLLPNPNHALWGEWSQAFLVRDRPDGVAEFTASLPFVALAVVAFGWVAARRRLPAFWIGFTLVFLLLALGPFIHVAGTNTYVPGPWALLRYVPVIGLARAPSRLMVVAMIGVAILFAFALAALRDRSPGRARAVTALCGVALAFELAPFPRTLHSAEVPAIYHLIANDLRRDLRVLELPVGIRDGTSSLGDHSAIAQFYQTAHERALIGGYTSRVSEQRKRHYRGLPVLNAMFALGEGRPLTDTMLFQAHYARGDFLRMARVGWVVVDRARTPAELREFAVDLLDLVKIAEDEGRELFRPRSVLDARTSPPPR
jgi:hypothetical protein